MYTWGLAYVRTTEGNENFEPHAAYDVAAAVVYIMLWPILFGLFPKQTLIACVVTAIIYCARVGLL